MRKDLYVDTVDGSHYVFPDYQYARTQPDGNDPWRLDIKDKEWNEIYFLLGAIVWFGEKQHVGNRNQ